MQLEANQQIAFILVKRGLSEFIGEVGEQTVRPTELSRFTGESSATIPIAPEE
jgi:hypothetical protein